MAAAAAAAAWHWSNDNCNGVTAPFRFIARLSNGLLRIYAGQYISTLIPPFVFLWPRSFFGRETFIKGYRGVTVKRGRVLTIGPSSGVISNNPFSPPLLRPPFSPPPWIRALKISFTGSKTTFPRLKDSWTKERERTREFVIRLITSFRRLIDYYFRREYLSKRNTSHYFNVVHFAIMLNIYIIGRYIQRRNCWTAKFNLILL